MSYLEPGPRVSRAQKAIPVLEQWAADARATTVTQGNAVATLQVVIDRLGVFFDEFANLLEAQYGRYEGPSE